MFLSEAATRRPPNRGCKRPSAYQSQHNFRAIVPGDAQFYACPTWLSENHHERRVRSAVWYAVKHRGLQLTATVQHDFGIPGVVVTRIE